MSADNETFLAGARNLARLSKRRCILVGVPGDALTKNATAEKILAEVGVQVASEDVSYEAAYNTIQTVLTRNRARSFVCRSVELGPELLTALFQACPIVIGRAEAVRRLVNNPPAGLRISRFSPGERFDSLPPEDR